LRAEILALRAGLVSLRGEPERACGMARAAVDLAPTDDLYAQGATRFCLATAYNYAGQTVAAIEAYQAALPFCRAAGNTVAAMLSIANLTLLTIERGQLHAAADLSRATIAAAEQEHTQHSPALAAVYGAYAHVLYEWNELDAALTMGQQALVLGQRSGHVAAVAYSNVVLSRIQAARGEKEAAERLLAAALPLRSRGMPAWVLPHLVSRQAGLALARNDPAAAQQALVASGVPLDAPTDHTREVIHLAWLRLLLHQAAGRRAGDPLFGQAQQLADKISESAAAGGRVGRVIEALSRRGLLRQAQGEAAAAAADLTQALRLAAPGGYVRVFTGQGAGMAQLLASLAPPPDLQAYIARLRDAFTAPPTGDPAAAEAAALPPLVEPLSAREVEVLRLLAAGLTYQEIAAQLIVSLNTVRFHVKSIYGKLGVDNRTAALEQARSRGLL
jgi:LuxR family maltose regulon positive regulatory protein